ncbi:FAD-binding dehydrogenase [Canicola haemoglobinophilus]|uniref:Succinate dehydrogenase/fumarate reductase, flavoprotein subunit n=1 Tax=Canicola haemoglobinophilus TaxID=733 RepID=A0A1V4AZV8_9PAST|nr:FAD-binding protein [Canicola haemoglobinophilus]OOR99072.1 FAD-binding dehydrogenase [Canicola haemoglobinophilus]STO54291.1 succinate dehydrogenase/fumarate reductase, flavoprotein subunit [Canicola haemoglobinophilus]STO60238.1 succinate dehydrogenase/fumarate reductase, flavoprotein subunit [Canicola haemoglobinophilus]STO68825.1 succinate dehydrogenase/fumarate reductase, flavoprotein subunit [Canicola haemoglobinophilus]
MELNIVNVEAVDILIVGSGIAGLIATDQALKAGNKVCLSTTGKLCGGASFFPIKATLGIQVTAKDISDKEKYKEDISNMGNHMDNPELIEAYINEIRENIFLLKNIGFKPWLRKDNRPACFAKYPREIYLINNWKEAKKQCQENLEKYENLTLLENSALIRIIKDKDSVIGAILKKQDEYVFIKTKAIILATGGIAGNYKHSLYPNTITGTGHIIALDAGAKAQNMEFIQFIPAFLEPKYNILFGEHTLKYCSGMYDLNNKLLLPGIDDNNWNKLWLERSAYAPFSFDFESHKIDLHINSCGTKLKFNKELYENEEEFYKVYLNWLKDDIGIDLLKDEIVITHFAHSCNGGIKIDTNGYTGILGLYAVGELSSAIEGANRLGGNSVGGALVFGKKAVEHIQQYFKDLTNKQEFNDKQLLSEFHAWIQGLLKSDGQNRLSSAALIEELKKIANNTMGIEREKTKLEQALKDIEILKNNYSIEENIYERGLEVYLRMETMKLLLLSMLARNESRGAHYRKDSPYTSDEIYKVILTRKDDITMVKKEYL